MKKPSESARAAAAKSKRKRIKFSFRAPEARKVFLAGSFNGWNTSVNPLEKDKKGDWATSVQLFPGRYEYRFFVDDEWMDDPDSTGRSLNIYGNYNSELSVE